MDRGGSILSRKVMHASEGDWKAVDGMLERLPIRPVSRAGDTAYNAGRLRHQLEQSGITAYIPIHPNQERNMVSKGGFDYRGDHLVCPEGKTLRKSAFHNRDRVYQHVAHQKDCQSCAVKDECQGRADRDP